MLPVGQAFAVGLKTTECVILLQDAEHLAQCVGVRILNRNFLFCYYSIQSKDG